MQGIIITIDKEELEDIISRAVEFALEKWGFIRGKEESEDIDEFIMKVPQLCKYLKMKVSTIYQLTHKNEIPCNKKGKTLYFRKDEIDKWVSEGKQLTKYEHNYAREIRISLADKKRNKSIA
ncbi:MAG: helix-turn-helix domain-containing protein [Ginsengibacter sp.]